MDQAGKSATTIEFIPQSTFFERRKLAEQRLRNLDHRSDVKVIDRPSLADERTDILPFVIGHERAAYRCRHGVPTHPLWLVTHARFVAEKHVLEVMPQIDVFDRVDKPIKERQWPLSALGLY